MTLSLRRMTLKDFKNSNKLLKNIIVNNEVIFNTVVTWINSKTIKKIYYLHKIKNIKISCHTLKDYCDKEYIPEENLGIFYLRSGELLALLYILNIKNLDQKSIISIGENPIVTTSNIEFSTTNTNQLFYANEIAKTIIDNSVYRLTFLPNDKFDIHNAHVAYIKDGFSLIYNIAIENKNELLALINKFTANENFNLWTVFSRIQNLNLSDMNNQVYFIDARFSKRSSYKSYINFSKNQLHNSIDEEKLMSISCKIGDYIIEKSIIGYKASTIERTWIGTVENGTVAPIGNSLYGGNGGVALFLAYLTAVTNKDYFIAASMEAIEPILRYIAEEKEDLLVSSKASKELIEYFYILSKLYKLTYNEKIKQFMQCNITILYKFINNNKELTVLAKSAVEISLLVSICNDLKDDTIKDKLLYLSIVVSSNIKEQLHVFKSNSFLSMSFSDGISGAICSVSKLFEITKIKALENLIEEMLKFERELYEKEGKHLKSGWFNGLSGILLSKLMLKKICYKDALLDKEIKNLTKAIIFKGIGDNPYYAYGQLGTLSILNYAAEALDDNVLKNRCDNTFNLIVHNVVNDYISENPTWSGQSVSLMNGLSGLGYSFIKKCNEDLVPEILFFD